MNKQTILIITRALVILTPVVWILWDFVAEYDGGNAYTESANIFVWSFNFPAISLAWGYLTGHFFAQVRMPSVFSIKAPRFKSAISIGALAFVALWFVFDLIHYPSILTWMVRRIPGPGFGAIETVLIGTIVGFFAFQMDDQTELA